MAKIEDINRDYCPESETGQKLGEVEDFWFVSHFRSYLWQGGFCPGKTCYFMILVIDLSSRRGGVYSVLGEKGGDPPPLAGDFAKLNKLHPYAILPLTPFSY